MSSLGPHFRAGVGAVIANGRGQVLATERSDIRGAWQFIQGGLEEDEELLQAALREVEEETGITAAKLQLVDQYPEPLVYELPREARSAKTGLGQVQYWFLFRYVGGDADIRLPARGEMSAWRWTSLDQVASGAAGFRHPVYERLVTRFSPLVRTGSA